MVGEDAGAAGRGDHGNVHALLQGFDAGPAPGALLPCAVQNSVDELPAVQIVGFPEDSGGDADQIAL